MAQDFHQTAPSFPTANDGQLTSVERQRITRRKRERRKREGDAALATGRDEVVMGIAMLSERELLRMSEVRERLDAVGPFAGHFPRVITAATAQEYLDHRHALAVIAHDYDGTLGDWKRLTRLLRDWDGLYGTQWRVDNGCSAAGVGLRKGRPGTESSMSVESIRLAVRSLALRPKARDELNREREAGVRGGGREQLTRHKHGPAASGRGATRADELAAAEASADGFKVTAAMVEKARRELRKVLAEV